MDEGASSTSTADLDSDFPSSWNKFGVSPEWLRSVLDLARQVEVKCADLQDISCGHVMQQGSKNHETRRQTLTLLEVRHIVDIPIEQFSDVTDSNIYENMLKKPLV